MTDLDAQVAMHKEVKDLAVCRLRGAVDTSTILKFQTALYRLRRQGIRRLVLDLEEISYINSTGFSVILKHAQSFKNSAGDLVLAKMPQKVYMVFEVLGLMPFLRVFGTVEEAVGTLLTPTEGGTIASSPSGQPNVSPSA